MKLTLRAKYAIEFAKKHKSFEDYVGSRFWYAREEDGIDLDISGFSDEDLKNFHEFLLEKSTDPAINGALQKLSVYNKIRTDKENFMPSDLNSLSSVLKEYINLKSDRKWLFKMGNDNMRLPYLVTKIEYHPADYTGGHERPAYTEVSIKYMKLDAVQTNSIHFGNEDLKQKGSQKINRRNAPTILEEKGYVVGMPELCEAYDKELEVFLNYRDKLGEQFISTGVGYEEGKYGSSGSIALNTDGTSHKLVVDEPKSRKIEGDTYVDATFWEKKKKDSEATFRLPIHPYIRIFNLKTHRSYTTHTSQMVPYVYNPKLIDKLILDDDVKELVEVLGNGTREELGDIIDGKAGGIIVGCVGKSGLGKSLTAEIYSEFLQRPLYTVQCSQLGTDPDTLEKRLMEVLDRAKRWRAILLLDEADVYIRARGEDLVQNAIVGVFLRLIEYYSGIMFLTSNLLNLDDAIESRFSAKIIYKNPTHDQLAMIWADQMLNHGWEVDKELISNMIDEYPDLTGRDVRSVLKLGTLLARYRKTKIDYNILKHAGKFGKLSEHKLDLELIDESN